MKAAQLFDTEEQKRIENAVKMVERNTSGEVAVMIVDESDSYREAAAIGAVVFAGFFALLAAMLLEAGIHYDDIWMDRSGVLSGALSVVAHTVTVWIYIPLVLLLYFPFKYLLDRVSGLKILFMPARRLQEEVRERAVRAFFEKGLYRTRDETGILIFISILERTVWILGDRGINEKISQDFWNAQAAELTRGMKAKDHCAALCEVIARCGEELARHFPRKADDTNELADGVLL
jgi:putative membrane protein